MQDWPDDMKISHEAFEEYAARIEQDDFEVIWEIEVCTLEIIFELNHLCTSGRFEGPVRVATSTGWCQKRLHKEIKSQRRIFGLNMAQVRYYKHINLIIVI